MTHRDIKDHYYTYYVAQEKEDKRRLSNEINGLLEGVPPKVMAMAIVMLVRGNKGMLDAKELNEGLADD